MKSNNADASKKENPSHEDGVGQGSHDAGKPIEPKEGDGYHSGRKLPKPSAVTTLPVEGERGVAAKHAATQNSTDGKEGSVNVVPSGRDFPTRTHGHK